MRSIEKILSKELLIKSFGNEYKILDFVFSSSGFLIFLIKTDKIDACYLENGLIQKIPIIFNSIESGKFAPENISIDNQNRIYAFMKEKESESIPSCVKLRFNGKIESYFFFKNHISRMKIDSNGNIFVSYDKMDDFLRENKLFEKYDASGELIASRFPNEQIQMTQIPDFFIDKKDIIYLVGINQKFASLHICYFVKMSSYLDIIDIYVDMEECSESNLSNISLDSQKNMYLLLKNSNTLKKFDSNKNFQNFALDINLNIKKIVVFNDELYLETQKEIFKMIGL